MQSKNNKILIGCLALLLVMSVGYALFSDTIEINGSATAQGEFELTTTCDMDISAVQDTGYLFSSGSVSDAKISCEGNEVIASTTLGYPGSAKGFRIMVENTGTIPAKLKRIVELNNEDEMICEKDNCPGTIENSKTNEDGTNDVFAVFYPDSDWNNGYANLEHGVYSLWDDAMLEAVLDPGETAYFYIQMEWGTWSTKPGDPLTVALNVEMDWEQATE